MVKNARDGLIQINLLVLSAQPDDTLDVEKPRFQVDFASGQVSWRRPSENFFDLTHFGKYCFKQLPEPVAIPLATLYLKDMETRAFQLPLFDFKRIDASTESRIGIFEHNPSTSI